MANQEQDSNQEVVLATNKKLESDRFRVSPIAAHNHNGFDAERIPYQNVLGRFIDIAWTLPGASAATAANYGTFYTAQSPCFVIGFVEVHETAGTDGSAVTLQLERLQGTTAPGSGTNILVTALNLKGTANTVQTAEIVKDGYTAIQTNVSFLSPGDRLALKDAGTLTSLAGVSTVTRLQLYP